MSLVASSISGAAYVLGNSEEKDTGNGFEFTRRKRWPQLLLQELTSSALFCLKPVPGGRGSVGSSDGKSGQNMGWKIMFVSPSVNEMLGTKPTDIDGRDFLDYVLPADHPQLISIFNSVISPHLTHQPSHSSSGSSSNLNLGSSSGNLSMTTSSDTLTTYVRMNIPGEGRPGSSKGHGAKNSGSSNSGSSSSNSNTSGPAAASYGGSGTSTPKTIVWEIRAHATGVEGQSDTPAFGLGGAGTMVPTTTTQGDEMKGKAVWVMGRRVGEGVGDESNGQSLDAFLELKLENEKLREELRELQSDFDEDDYQTAAFPDLQPQRQAYDPSASSSPTPLSSSSSPPSSPALAAQSQQPRPKAGPGRPPKDLATKEKDKEAAREKKRAKKTAASRAVGGTGGGNDAEGGMHVCVTCGRTDSPEWRKGPLGPKTLCNACGLRWAKRNSTAPTRKDKKAPGASGPSK